MYYGTETYITEEEGVVAPSLPGREVVVEDICCAEAVVEGVSCRAGVVKSAMLGRLAPNASSDRVITLRGG